MPRGKSVIASPKARMTMEQGLELFINDCQARNLRPYSIETYKGFIGCYIKYMETKGEGYVDCITKKSMQDWILYEKGTGIKDTTIASKVRNTRAWVYFLFREGVLVEEFKIALPKADASFKEPYTDEELSLLLSEPTSSSFVEYRTWALEALLIGTGARLSTALNLKISDIKFEEGYVNFTKLKNRSVQLTPISSRLKEILMIYLSLWNWEEDDYLFNNSYEIDAKSPIARRTAQQEIKRYNNSRGVSKTSAHLFRHTFAKNYIIAGGGVFQLQQILGHSDISTTRHYVMLYGSDLSRDFDLLCPLDRIG